MIKELIALTVFLEQFSLISIMDWDREASTLLLLRVLKLIDEFNPLRVNLLVLVLRLSSYSFKR